MSNVVPMMPKVEAGMGSSVSEPLCLGCGKEHAPPFCEAAVDAVLALPSPAYEQGRVAGLRKALEKIRQRIVALIERKP